MVLGHPTPGTPIPQRGRQVALGGSWVGVVGVGRGRQKKAVGEVLGVPMRERTDTIQLPTQ